MIATSETAWKSTFGFGLDYNYSRSIKKYTPEEVAKIIDSGSILEK